MCAQAREHESALLCELHGRDIALRDEDLTPAGLFVPTTQPEPLDRELDLRLRSPLGEATLHALVVQVIDCARAASEQRRAGFGVLFTELLDDQRAFIGLTLDALARARNASLKPAPGSSSAPASASASAPTSARPKPSQAPARKRASSQAIKAQARPSLTPKQTLPVAQTPEQARKAAELVRTLSAELAALQGKPSWSVLGLESGATPEQARAAFIAVSKRCHPHRYARYDSAELTRVATELFVAYKRASSVVGKLAARVDTVQAIVPAGQSLRPPTSATVTIRPGTADNSGTSRSRTRAGSH